MENASEALFMAFAVLVFVVALSIGISSFSLARQTTQASDSTTLVRLTASRWAWCSGDRCTPDKQKKESLRRMTLLTWCHQESNRGHKANLQTMSVLCSTAWAMARIYRKKESLFTSNSFQEGGATRNRTGDTRIFSPLLYHLSYGTIVLFVKRMQRQAF